MTLIELCNVSVTRGDTYVLRDISLSLKRGEHLAVVGPNGAGKSFLLRLLAADLMPSRGQISLLGERIGNVNLWKLREQVGFISTRIVENFPPGMKVSDVVLSGFFGTYGLASEASEDQIERAHVTLSKFACPNAARRFDSLSDGEQRRVLLCRSLVLEPKLVVLDEPCQGLDIRAREELLAAIETLASETAVVYVAHHLEEIPRAITHVFAIRKGVMTQLDKKEIVLTSKFMTELFEYPVSVLEQGGRYFFDYSEMRFK